MLKWVLRQGKVKFDFKGINSITFALNYYGS